MVGAVNIAAVDVLRSSASAAVAILDCSDGALPVGDCCGKSLSLSGVVSVAAVVGMIVGFVAACRPSPPTESCRLRFWLIFVICGQRVVCTLFLRGNPGTIWPPTDTLRMCHVGVAGGCALTSSVGTGWMMRGKVYCGRVSPRDYCYWNLVMIIVVVP